MVTLSAACFDQRTGDMGDLSNKLYLVDEKSNKSNVWKYFALRVNEDDKVMDSFFISFHFIEL